MASSADRRLEWVQRNRTRASRTVSVGSCVERQVKLAADGPAASRELFALIDSVVDAEFREVCTLASAPKGGIVILANHPVVLAAMRSKWLSRIQRAVSREGRKTCPVQIQFQLA